MTGKVEISEEVRNDVETIYLHSNVSVMENNKISVVISLDQIQLKYVPGCNKTLAPTGIKSVSVAGSTDKRTITATLNIYQCRSSTAGKLQKAYHLSPFLIVFWYLTIKSITVMRRSH